MSLGDLLDETFALYRRNFALFAGIVAVISVPETVINTVLAASRPASFVVKNANGTSQLDSNALSQTLVLGGVQILIGIVLSQIIVAALSRAVSDRYLNRSLTVGQAYASIGGRTLVTLLVALFLFILLIGVTFFLVIIPAVYFYVRYAFIPQAIVLERTGVRAAFSRSSQLVRGSWWRVFGILLVVTLLVAVLNGVVSAVVIALVTVGSASGTAGTVITQSLSGIINIFVQPIQLGATVLLYYDLRIRKEGFDLELAAASMEGRQPL
jgi:hypothetical protein